MRIVNPALVAAGKQAAKDLGTEVRVMTRAGESEAVFLKPMDTDRAKLLLSYVQHLEDELASLANKHLDAEAMARKFGVAITAMAKIKDLPDMASDLKVKAVKEVVEKAFLDIEKA